MNRASFTVLFALAAVGVSACAPAMVRAQADPDSVHHRNNCRLAEQVLETGHPSPREEWALNVIWNCADAGPTLAARLRAARTSTDTAYLDALTAPFIRIRDGAVFVAATAIAKDPGASIPARLAAIRTLMYGVRPGGAIHLETLADPGSGACFGAPSPHSRVLQGTPLPPDYVAQVRSLASRIQTNAAEPRAVRNAAACATYIVRGL